MSSVDAICSVDGCSDSIRVKRDALCHRHYLRYWKYGDPLAGPPLGPKRVKGTKFYMSPNRERDTFGRKRCTACDEWLDPSLFKANNHMADGLLSCCRRCYQDNDYNLSLGRRNQMLKEQNWKCATAACTQQVELYGPNTYHVDHDHKCCPSIGSCGECIRGLLCKRCNRLLGLAGDSAAMLLALADYLSVEA